MIFQHIEGLVQKGLQTQLIESADETYVRNQVLGLLKLETFPEAVTNVTDDTIPNLLDQLIAYAIETDVIEDIFDDKEMLSAQIMDCFVARPSIINDTFNAKYAQSPKAATQYFYELSQNSNYIQTNRIAKNIHFKADTVYGPLDITINMSKPEKDPEQIKRERTLKKALNYPKCVLCPENEGYIGRIGYAARANHRIIRIPLLNENWYFQYSPYVYYPEHSIVLAEEHRDMHIDRTTFERLLAFTEAFPHYFIGSNADLPIVGGSILNHDHYQAGHYDFPMDNATAQTQITLNRFNDVTAEILEWPLSVIRLRSAHQDELVQAADHILQTWQGYSDVDAHIEAFTDDTPHNTITPIARMRDGLFELDLVLRNNRTTDRYPLGIFHPHEDVHHIKKENIGLIEVMGLAVLPARLDQEINEIKHFLFNKTGHVEAYHMDWVKEIVATYPNIKDMAHADEIMQAELGRKFARVLENAGVFKNLQTFQKFVTTLNE